MDREQLQTRIDNANASIGKHMPFAAWGIVVGVMLGSGAIAAEVVDNPRTAAAQAIGSGISFAVSLIAHEEAKGCQQEVATYEAAQYVVEQLQWPTIPEDE